MVNSFLSEFTHSDSPDSVLQNLSHTLSPFYSSIIIFVWVHPPLPWTTALSYFPSFILCPLASSEYGCKLSSLWFKGLDGLG